MRFMIIVKATPQSEAGEFPEDKDKLFAAMAEYHEQLAAAGVLLDASGLQPSSKGWRIRYDGNKRTVVDGPFAETKELIAGYTLIQVRDRDEALEWTRRFPNPVGEGKPAEIEVRQLYELEDFNDVAPDDALDRFRALESDRPASGTFLIKRSVTIDAKPERIYPFINDPRKFNTWNPFARKVPSMKMDYRGPAQGPGAAYDFDGGPEFGIGSVEVVASNAPSSVGMRLQMSAPMPCDNRIEFTLVPRGGATEVTWAMSGPRPSMDCPQGQFDDMDRMVGADFEEGLAFLKSMVERA